MKKIILLLALTISTLLSYAQQTNKPAGAVTMSPQWFRVTLGDLNYIFVPGVNKYYNLSTKEYVDFKAAQSYTKQQADSLLALKVNASQLPLYQTRAEKGVANGYASLNSAGKVPLNQIDDALLGAVNYRGTYNAATNTPAMPAAQSSNKGYYYIVSTAGSQFGLSFRVGDWIISNGSSYGKVSSSSDVESVNGKKGVVNVNLDDVLTAGNTSEQAASFGAVIAGSASVTSAPTQPTHVVRQSDLLAYQPIATAVTSVASKTGAVTLNKYDVQLGNVDNTSDVLKPISNPTNAALNLKADKSEIATGQTIGANTSGSADKWNNVKGNLSVAVSGLSNNIGGLIAYDIANNEYRYAESPILRGYLGIGNGSTLNNSISGNAASIGGQAIDFNSYGNDLTWITGLNGTSGIKPFNANQVKSWLGIASSGETLQSITNRGNTTTTPITVSGLGVVGTAPDLFFNQLGGSGFNTFQFARENEIKVAIGRNDTDDFYITRSANNAFFDDSFVLKRLTGKVGIGTQFPTSKLTIQGVNEGAAIDLNNTQSGTGKNMRVVSLNTGGLAIEDVTSGTARLTINGDGLSTFGGSVRVGSNDGSSTAVARNVDLQGKANLSGGNSFTGNGVQNFIGTGDQRSTIQPGILSNTNTAGTAYSALGLYNMTFSANTNQTSYQNGFITSNITGSNKTFNLPTVSGYMLTGFRTSVTLDFPNVMMNQNAVITQTVNNVDINDVVTIGLPNSLMSNMTNWNGVFQVWVSAANTLNFRFQNNDPMAAHDLPATTFNIFIHKQ